MMNRHALLLSVALLAVCLAGPVRADAPAPPPAEPPTQEVEIEIKDHVAGKDTTTRFTLVVTRVAELTSRSGDAVYSIKILTGPRAQLRVEVSRSIGAPGPATSDLHLEAERALDGGKAVMLGVIERADGSRTQVSALRR